WHHAGNMLHRVPLRASLHHRQLPADRAVLVGLPANAAEDGAGQEHAYTPHRVQAGNTHRITEAQVDLDALRHVDEGHARQRRRVSLAATHGNNGVRRRHGSNCLYSHPVFSGNSRSKSPRSNSATVMSWVNADTLIRARNAGVMSRVRRALYRSRLCTTLASL